jgi:hypothetical protein
LRSGLLKKLVLTLLLLPAMIYLTRAGVADFLRLEPCAYLEAVQLGEVPLDPAGLASSRERLLLARSWDTGNPIIPEFLGQIALMRTQLSGFSPRLQSIFLNEAIDDFQVAIRLRPNSAYLWAARMSAGSMMIAANERLERDDALVEHELSAIKFALRRAGELGPWEPSVLQQMVKVGTLHYMELSPEERAIVDGAVAREKKLKIVT